MIQNFFIFGVSLLLVIKSATLATKYAYKLGDSFKVSKYTIGFIVIAIISILPETFISINSALEGTPSFGLATLFGSNIADLTLIFAIIVFLAGHGIKIESKILQNNLIYPFFLLIPITLGLDGYYSRLEGVSLIIVGSIFYYLAYKSGTDQKADVEVSSNERNKYLLLLISSMALLLIGSHFTVTSAADLANNLKINPILIGILVVGLGTTMPELFFSLQSMKTHNSALAVGDILGTVLADATIVVGILAFINPFSFPQKIIYTTGVFMVTASILVFYFMNSGRYLSKKESFVLFIFWLVFILIEMVVGS